MWDAIEEIAKVKMVVNMARTSMGCKWERGWFEFVRKVWRMESPGWGWDELNCIYVITAPYTRGEYVGETKCGAFHRWRGHIRKTWKGMQELYLGMRKVGPFRTVLTPLYCWGRVTEKIERLRHEGKYIWERGARWNIRGRQEGGDIRRVGGGSEVIFGQRRKFRKVIRLRKKEEDEMRGKECYIGGWRKEREKEERGREKAKDDAKMRALTARMARRPWKWVDEDSEEHRAVKEVRTMPETKVKHMVRMVTSGMDATSRSIARYNAKNALRKRKGIVWVHVKVKSTLMSNWRVKREVKDELRRWSKEVKTKKDLTIIMEAQYATSAGRSMVQALNNTEYEAKKRRDEHA